MVPTPLPVPLQERRRSFGIGSRSNQLLEIRRAQGQFPRGSRVRYSGSTRTATTVMLSRPPLAVGHLDQPVAHPVQVGFVGDDIGDLGVRDHARQTVGAEQVHVAQPGLLDQHVDLHRVLHAERAHDDVLVREVRDLLGREVLHLDVVVEQRVVLGELLELAVAQAVDAAVADVADDHRLVREAVETRVVPMPRQLGLRWASS